MCVHLLTHSYSYSLVFELFSNFFFSSFVKKISIYFKDSFFLVGFLPISPLEHKLNNNNDTNHNQTAQHHHPLQLLIKFNPISPTKIFTFLAFL